MIDVRNMKQCIKAAVMSTAILGFGGTAIAADFVSVVKDGVNLRSGPDTSNQVLYELPKGYPLKVISRKGKWIKVNDYENDKGWIYASIVSKNPYSIVKVKEANVRKGPGTNHAKVGKVVKDVIFKRLSRKGEWVKVQHPQLTGWIHQKLIWP